MGGGETKGRGPQRILVRSQLDDGGRIEAELPCDHLDGSASLIDGLGEDGPIG